MAEDRKEDFNFVTDLKEEYSVKKIKTESLEIWENDTFKQLDTMGADIEFFSDASDGTSGTLKRATEQLLVKFSRSTSNWDFPTIHHKKATLLVALYLDTGIHWDHKIVKYE